MIFLSSFTRQVSSFSKRTSVCSNRDYPILSNRFWAQYRSASDVHTNLNSDPPYTAAVLSTSNSVQVYNISLRIILKKNNDSSSSSGDWCKGQTSVILDFFRLFVFKCLKPPPFGVHPRAVQSHQFVGQSLFSVFQRKFVSPGVRPAAAPSSSLNAPPPDF